ncbi:hypothetical protein O3P69_016363 [Scylla paramamosain]|uniref:Uncharacterized protein n=1 Tax=Scylla paramamosain TaxID=85552 RepID=A0AAW0TEB3_SCYPA
MSGFSRADVMQRTCTCDFLYGPLTSSQAIQQVQNALATAQEVLVEALYYKKDVFRACPSCILPAYPASYNGVVWCCLVPVLCSTGVSVCLPPASRNTPRPGHCNTPLQDGKCCVVLWRAVDAKRAALGVGGVGCMLSLFRNVR